MKLYIPTFQQSDKIRIGDLCALMTIAQYETTIKNNTIFYDCSDPLHQSLKADVLFANTIEKSTTTTINDVLLDDSILWVKAPNLLSKYGNQILPKLNIVDELYTGVQIPHENFIVLSTLIHPEYNFHRKMEIPFLNDLIKQLEQKFDNIFIITDEANSLQTKTATIIKTDSLYNIVYLISKAQIYIGGDTGFTHFAALARVPHLISLYGINHIFQNFVTSGEYQGIPFNCMPLIDNTTTNHFSFILEHNRLTPKQIQQVLDISTVNLKTKNINTIEIIQTYLDIENNRHAVSIINNYLINNQDSKEIWHLLGRASSKHNKDLSIKAYLTSIELDSSNIEVYLDLARCYYHWKDFEEASHLMLSLLEQQPKNAQAYLLLGYIQSKQNNLSDAFECLKQAYELDTKNSIIADSLARAIQEIGDIQTAKNLYEEAIKNDITYAAPYFHLSQIEFLLGNYKRGWELYEYRYNITAKSRMKNLPLPMPKYNKENLNNKKIFIYHEQGLGDTIQFIRYSKELIKQGAKVTAFVQKPVLKLLKSNFKDIKFITDIEDSYDCDHHLSMLSLPFYLELYEPIKEYKLSVKEKEIKIKDKNKLKVGLVWQGNKEHPNDHNRSIKPSLLNKLAKLKNIQLYSLQKDATKDEQKKISKDMIDLVRKSKNFYDTAQAIQELDLVITIDSGVAHLAATLGKETWILLPHNPDWRWKLEDNTTPWYKTATLFRKKQNQPWDETITILVEKLKLYIT